MDRFCDSRNKEESYVASEEYINHEIKASYMLFVSSKSVTYTNREITHVHILLSKAVILLYHKSPFL